MFAVVFLLLQPQLLLLASGASGRKGKRCLSEFQPTSVTSTHISLGWNYACSELGGVRVARVRYKVYYNHQDWLGCKGRRHDAQKGSGRGDFEVTDGTSLSIPDLHPYSRYLVSIKALPEMSDGRAPAGIPEEVELEIDTGDEEPLVKPVASSIGTKVTDGSLRFYWRPPLPSECRYFNGRLDGYAYVLKGDDRWNAGFEARGETGSTNHEFADLRPMSSYVLFVYAKNSNGLINRAAALKIEASTHPRNEPERPPRDLTIVPLAEEGERRGFSLRWLPPYPPTSLISEYVVRWKKPGAKEWMRSFPVDAGNAACGGEEGNDRELTCFALEDPRDHADAPVLRDVTVQVAAVSPEEKMSPWSAAVTFKAAPDDGSASFGGYKILAAATVVSVVVVFALVLLVILVRYKRQKRRYNNVPAYDSNYAGKPQMQPQAHSPAPPESLQSDDTMDFSVGRNSIAMSSFGSSKPPLRSSLVAGAGQRFDRSSSSASASKPAKDYSHLFLPSREAASAGVSIQGTPLPPVPGKEPVYEELCQDTLLKNRRPSPPRPHTQSRHASGSSNHRGMNGGCVTVVDCGGGGAGSDSDFLKPLPPMAIADDDDDGDDDGNDGEEEGDYLKPKNHRKVGVSTSDREDDDGNDEYLKPTFNQVEIIDPNHCMPPPDESPPAIPIQSYTPIPNRKS